MREFIERGATAIRNECKEHSYLGSIHDNDRLWENLFRAAIGSMREPTEEILWAGIRASSGGVLCSWQAMLDEVMK